MIWDEVDGELLLLGDGLDDDELELGDELLLLDDGLEELTRMGPPVRVGAGRSTGSPVSSSPMAARGARRAAFFFGAAFFDAAFFFFFFGAAFFLPFGAACFLSFFFFFFIPSSNRTVRLCCRPGCRASNTGRKNLNSIHVRTGRRSARPGDPAAIMAS
jgi:hypothetical protein